MDAGFPSVDHTQYGYSLQLHWVGSKGNAVSIHKKRLGPHNTHTSSQTPAAFKNIPGAQLERDTAERNAVTLSERVLLWF